MTRLFKEKGYLFITHNLAAWNRNLIFLNICEHPVEVLLYGRPP